MVGTRICTRAIARLYLGHIFNVFLDALSDLVFGSNAPAYALHPLCAKTFEKWPDTFQFYSQFFTEVDAEVLCCLKSPEE